MNLQELKKHTRALHQANNAGIQLMWSQEMVLDHQVFLSIVENYQLDTTTQFTGEGYRISFRMNGMLYHTFANQLEYEHLFESKSHKKMTS
ncbi:hypothetical protein F3157_07965 [Virgibacillus dakarensis]|uniref:Uncharacterized protein n=1 Tax=Lentibacillus populi TaxID=1827502 RepID=A0A9W5TY50_9BACI|nr:hypothetical protein [Lentibacillus populi]MTW85598.1 hypothetical protein [Virgibacillus dakarensis]GGB41424.1 hypothetical protein GCM10011409_18690 [Lentibacillus populi]